MDDGEENYSPEFDDWRLITGKFGTFMTRTILTDDIKNAGVKITMGMIDDITKEFPPEKYPGSIGYVWQDWDFSDMKKGTYYLYVESYTPPYYVPGDEREYLHYMDNPVKIRVANTESTSQLLLKPEYEKRYKKYIGPVIKK
jgi:hypothetical protein